MGCQSSSMVRVAPATPSAAGPGGESKAIKQVAAENAKNSKISRNDSRTSLKSDIAEEADGREKSAVSKASRKSGDSGFYHDDAGPELEGDENAHIITEYSDTQLVMQVESTFRPAQDLDLSLCGVPAPRNLSAKDKARQEERQIIETLRQEGLIAKPQMATKSGLSFEIVQESPAVVGRALPARLSKLELSQTKRRKKASQRGGVQSIAEAPDGSYGGEVDGADTSGATADRSQEAADQQQVQQQAEKEKSALENRERRLQELRDKLKAKEAHAAAVRERKKLGVSVGGEAQSEDKTF